MLHLNPSAAYLPILAGIRPLMSNDEASIVHLVGKLMGQVGCILVAGKLASILELLHIAKIKSEMYLHMAYGELQFNIRLRARPAPNYHHVFKGKAIR